MPESNERISRSDDTEVAGKHSKSELHALKQQAESAISNLQQILDGHKLDDVTSQKLAAIIERLKGATEGGTISRASLSTALAEAEATISAGAGKEMSPRQKAEKIWQKIDAANSAIDDDFEKMRQSGIKFGDTLWNKHKELKAYLISHPHDLSKQKELDAIDDVMLMQAQPQLKNHHSASDAYEDAEKQSKGRHQLVDTDLSAVVKSETAYGSAFADKPNNKSELSIQLTLNDVVSPPNVVMNNAKAIHTQR